MKKVILGSRYEVANGKSWRGGMSEVYVGKDRHLDRPVILKCLQPFQKPQRILDEQKALQEVVSKHVVQLLDVVQETVADVVRTFLVVEFIDGNDLQESALNFDDDYLLTLWQIASGLSEIHKHSVIHRDIKPGNIRIDREGVVKIIDFGLARQQGVNNQTQGAIGTRPYIAPEMLADATINFSTSADVFSFALTALTLLKRVLPSWVVQPERTIPRDAVKSHIPEFPPSVSDVLQRCLSEAPEDRPSMREVCSEITNVLLLDKHSAQLVMPGNVMSVIDKNQRESFPKVVIKKTKEIVSGIRIKYTGTDFVVKKNVGGVLANNISIDCGDALAPSCVIAFPSGGEKRYFATFNVNRPEVIV